MEYFNVVMEPKHINVKWGPKYLACQNNGQNKLNQNNLQKNTKESLRFQA